MENLKRVARIQTAPGVHTVGDGFRVKSMIPRDIQIQASPFLMLDYNEPWEVMPTDHPRGVGVHPHKGFETVTIVWDGHLAHGDSSGAAGEIGPGDVQWMTAGKGILHKEYHEENFSRKGGTFHVAQLWVNLPAAHKNEAPGYQDIRDHAIPRVAIPENGGYVRVIAGEYGGQQGPAKTFTPVQLWDVHMQRDGQLQFEMPEGDTLQFAVLSGNVLINGVQARGSDWLLMSPHQTGVEIESNGDSHILVMAGQPIREPIVAYGPFVMNSKQEILDAMEEFQNGAFGELT